MGLLDYLLNGLAIDIFYVCYIIITRNSWFGQVGPHLTFKWVKYKDDGSVLICHLSLNGWIEFDLVGPADDCHLQNIIGAPHITTRCTDGCNLFDLKTIYRVNN